ncbi:MAG: hypothetical protein UIC49_04480 [Paludibacteraceae bacterium]|nr:hypothetical protein [Paludibacteraceae bacterium]
MTNKKHLGEILTEQDLVLAWKHMLREAKAKHVEVDLDRLAFGLVDITRTHYMQMSLSRPQMQALEDFNRDRWWWSRLVKRIKKAKITNKMHEFKSR